MGRAYSKHFLHEPDQQFLTATLLHGGEGDLEPQYLGDTFRIERRHAHTALLFAGEGTYTGTEVLHSSALAFAGTQLTRESSHCNLTRQEPKHCDHPQLLRYQP